MASNEGIQTFAQTAVTPRLPDPTLDEQSDAMRQDLAKKTAWVSPTEQQFDALVKLLKRRLDEGHGETILEIGTGGSQKIFVCISIFGHTVIRHVFAVGDGESPGLLHDEMETSVATLRSMQALLDCEIQFLRERASSSNNVTRSIQEFLVRRHIDPEDFMEVR